VRHIDKPLRFAAVMHNSRLDSSITDSEETLEFPDEDVYLFPLSFAQQRLWFLQQMNPQSPAYNMPVASRLLGRLDVEALEQTLNEIAQRHEILRTTFQMIDARPMQVISPRSALKMPLLDLTHLPEAAREAEAHRLAVEDVRQPFDLVNGPLVRASLLRMNVEDHVLLLTMHHIISDGWSISVMVHELAALYNSFSTAIRPTLPALPIQYADYAQWQRSWLTGEVFEAQLDYWKRRLEGAPPVLEVPTDRPRPAIQSFRGSLERFIIAEDVVKGLRELCQQEGATLFMILLAAFQTLLHRYAGQDVIVVGTPIAGRNRQELEGLIGFFINTLVMRADFRDDLSFRRLLAEVKETALGAYAHQEFPFDKLVEELHPQRDLSHMPIIQAMFALQNTPDEAIELPGLTIKPVSVDSGTAQFDLSLNVWERDAVLTGHMAYRTDLFDAATVKRMLAHFQTLLKSIVNRPDERVSALPLLSVDERRQLLHGWNRPESPSQKSLGLHRLFEAQAEAMRSATALVFEGEPVSYDELNGRANRLAHHLRALGVGPEVRVCLMLERSVEMIVVMLAILKAGGAYVPLDPTYPTERLAFLLGDSGAQVLVTRRSLLEKSGSHKVTVVCLDADSDVIDAQPEHNPAGKHGPDNLAYVIYTSGSTGKPKGVMVTHRNVARLLAATRDWFKFDSSDVWTLFHSSAFDFSVWEIWGALLSGGRLVIVPYGVSRSPEDFYSLLTRERITVLNQTPSAFRQLMRVDEARHGAEALSLRAVIFGGEALELSSLKAWMERHGDARPQLVNMYGITETTVHVTYRPLTLSDVGAARGSVIGEPIPDLQLYILDKNLEPVPHGVCGEIHVGGAGLARGYLNRAALTAERFIPDPFAAEAGARLYRTGDLARRLVDGDIEYLGRLDEQVKVRGFRIELGEIETMLLTHTSIREAAVVARADASGDRRLVAYVVAGQKGELRFDELRAYLRERLPEHMLPAIFVEVEELPLTAHGKLDKRRLPEPGRERPEFENRYEAARNAVEDMLSELWSELLGVERVGIHDDFFDLGGDSIKGVIFINRLQERLGEIVHVVTIFNAPTIASFASYLAEQHPSVVANVTGVSVASLTEIGEPAPDADESSRLTGIELARVRKLIEPLPPRVDEGAALKNRPAIFILAPPRSGTTLLRVMLGGHPRLFSPPELELLSFNTLEERRKAFSGAFNFWLEGSQRAIMEIKGCDAEEAANIMRALEERRLSTREFYRLMQEWIGDRTLVDKTPSYALHTSILKRAEVDFENPLYIHLLRHPRGMIRSFVEAKLDQIFFRHEHAFNRRELAELLWTISHQNILEFLQDVPAGRQHSVKFEDLVGRPRESLEQICEFLRLELHTDMLQPYKEKERRMTDGVHPESRMLGDVKFHSYTGIEASVGERWKEDAGGDSLAGETQAVAGLLGYDMLEERTTARVEVSLTSGQSQKSESAPRSFLNLLLSRSQRPLVALQAKGSLRPFFCVHAVGGNVFSYVGLARHLGQQQPFYALQARGLMDAQEPHTRVEDMAADYVQAIRAAQENGPYILGGWSMGGLIAFEMARQLQRQGQKVSLVALFDSMTPYAAKPISDNEHAMHVANFAFQLGLPREELANVSEQFLSFDDEAQLKYLFEQAKRRGILPVGFDSTQFQQLFKVYRRNNEAVQAYRPGTCSAPLVLFRAAEKLDDEPTDPALGWSHLAKGSLEVEEVAGNHFTMLDEPHVSLLAERLRVHLARANQEGASAIGRED
jgi:amino acid adenylation domain-containing protein